MKKPFLTGKLIIILCLSNNATAQTTTITHFSDTATGSTPRGAVYFDGTYLYGTLSQGGAPGLGTIFRVNTDGSNFLKLKEYSDTTEGRNPCSGFYNNGTYLYGTTRLGGTSDFGTLFRMLPNGSGYTKLHDFGLNSVPLTAPIQVGSNLYGVTPNGGTYFVGTIYRCGLDGSGFTTIFSFQNALTGYSPEGPLYSDGTYLYGVCNGGMPSMNGSIYRILLDGTGFQLLHEFDNVNGKLPEESLISDGTFLYGVTYLGGANNMGVIYKIMPDGSGFTAIKHFAAADGYYPTISLIYLHGKLYGCGGLGGANGVGTLFSINTDGSNFTVLADFTIAGGGNPIGALASDGVNIYGLAQGGGANLVGALFKYQYSGVGIDDNSATTSFKLYPNPADENIVLSLDQNKAEYITIVDENGKMVYENKGLFEGNINIPVDQLVPGMYIMSVYTNRKMSSQTFIVKH